MTRVDEPPSGSIDRIARTAPAPPKATRVQLVFMTYAVICSGAYGLEEMVSQSGPGLAIIVLVLLPLVYAAPIALTCAELAARHPVEGGYYRWVRLAFGDLAGYTAAWLMWLTMFATTASFAVLFGNYLRYFVADLSAAAHAGAAAAVVWLAVLLNYRGISIVGKASVLFTVVILAPFVLMTIMGLLQWRHNPVWPIANPDKPFTSALLGGVLIAMWLYGGFEKLTVTAEEVDDPARAFPIAILIGVPLCAASYILPTLAALAATGEWRQWGPSHYLVAAAQIGGPWLGAAIAAGALVSNAGILMATMLGQSRLPMVLAEDGLFPRAFQIRHTRFGTPVVSLFVTGVVLTGLCLAPFTQLVAAAALVQSLCYLLIYAALFRLRRSGAGDVSGFRIPLGPVGLALLISPSILIVCLVLREGTFPGGHLDLQQLVLDLGIVVSGPLTYALARRRGSRTEQRSAVASGGSRLT